MNISKLIISFLLCFLTALLGSLVTTPSITTWYLSLNKPFFNPPNWIFGPVWTILYTFMAISLYLVWKKGKNPKIVKKALLIFFVQLGLNFLWSLVFFGLHRPLEAFVVIVCLWIAILSTIICFKKISKPAWILLVPYLLWVTFASILNFFIVILN